MERNIHLDSLKFYLFIGVFLFHAGLFCPLGWGGVTIYLSITSFFLTTKLIEKNKEEINVKKMVAKRWKRLSPLYLIVIVIMTVYYWIQNKSIPGDFWSYFVYGQNFYWAIKGDIGTRVPASYHFWYLTLDFYLFLIWTIVIKCTKSEYLKNLFWGLLGFSVLYRSVIPYISDNALLAYTMPWGMMDAFSIGGLLALYTKEKKPLQKVGSVSMVLSLVLFVVCVIAMKVIKGVGIASAIGMYSTSTNYGGSAVTMQIFTVMTLLACALICYCLSVRKKLFFSNTTTASLGGMSYELYVLHFPVLFFVGQTNINRWIIGLAAFLITLGLSKLWRSIYK